MDDLVLEPPRFKVAIVSVHAYDSDSASFDCQASGNPKPELLWYKDGTQIEGCDTNFTVHYGEDGQCSLVIPEVGPTHAGSYACEASNELDAVMCEAKLYYRGGMVILQPGVSFLCVILDFQEIW